MRVGFPSRSCFDTATLTTGSTTSANLVDGLTRKAQRLCQECPGRTWCVALLLFSFALLWRALYLHQTAAASPFFDAPMGDAQGFFQQAEQFAATFSLGEEPFTGPPLYPAFLGALIWLFGADYFAFRLIQFTLGALSVVLLYLIGRRVFSPGVGLAAGAAASVYGPLVYFEGELLPPGLAILLNLSLVLFLLRAGTVSRPWTFLAAGLLLGVAGLAVPHVFLFGPGVAGWMLLRRDSGLPARLGRVLLLALGVFLVIGGTTWRNYHKGGDLVLLSSDSGLRFFLGNNPDRERTAGLGPGADRDELMAQPVRQGLEKPSEQSAYFWRAAVSFAREEPAAFLRSLAAKAFDFWQGGEVRGHTDIYFARAHSALLAGLVWHHGLAFPFGIVGPLAVVGLLLAVVERRAGLIVLFVLCHAAAVVAFSPTARYRLPAVPLLILLACYAAAWLKDRVSARQWRSALPAAGLLLLVAWPLNARAVAPAEDARDRYYVGLAYAGKGMPARAALELRKALDLDEGHYDARLKLGELLVDLDNPAEAREQFRLLARRYPLRADPRRNLAKLHLGEQRIEEAAALFEEIVELEPTAARSHYGLAGALRLAGRPEAARDSYLKALELDPDHFEAGYHLAVLYQQEGRWGEAERLYLQLLEQRPGHDDVRNNLGYNYLRQRQFQAAEAEFSHVLDGNPDHVLARRNLAFAYEGLERNREAVQEYERLIERGEEVEVYNHLARLYGKMGQTEKAREARRKHRMVLRREEIFGKLRERTEQMFEEAAGAR